MLRVSYSESGNGQRWTVCGRLAGPWVDELRSLWRAVREKAPRARAVVDLREVTFIDEHAEQLLGEMHVAGTEFVVAGVANQYLLECLKSKERRALRRTLEDLSVQCGKRSNAEEGEK